MQSPMDTRENKDNYLPGLQEPILQPKRSAEDRKTPEEIKKQKHIEAVIQWRQKNPVKARSIVKAYRERNRGKIQQKRREQYWANPEKYRAASRNWAKNNPQKSNARHKESGRKYRERHRTELRTKARNYYADPIKGPLRRAKEKIARDKRYAIKGPNRSAKRKEYEKKYYAANKQRYSEQNEVRRKKLRLEVFAAYGGPICKCCNETILNMLSIDHINHGRGKPAQRIGTGNNFYYWLKKEKFPQGEYQVLCIGCNQAKNIYGVCPHQLLRTPIDDYFQSLGSP